MNFSSLCEAASVSSVKLLFIGGGNMTTSIVDGVISSGFASESDVAICVATAGSADRWKKKGFSNAFTSVSTMLSSFPNGIVVFAVKPQIRHYVYRNLDNGSLAIIPLVVSIMAGVSSSSLKEELAPFGYSRDVVRLMPNTPCGVGAGCTLLSADNVDGKYRDIVRGLAECVGSCVEVSERIFNAGAAVSACGPAWTFMFIESLADGGVFAGCPRAEAMKLAAQMVMGSAKLVIESGVHPGILKDQVCSAGGTTIAGLRQLELGGFRSAIIEAVKAATDRANDLSS